MPHEKITAWLKSNLKLAAYYYLSKPSWLPHAIANARNRIAKIRTFGEKERAREEETLKKQGMTLEDLEGVLSQMEANGINLAHPYAKGFDSDMSIYSYSLTSNAKAIKDMATPPAEGDEDVRELAIRLAQNGEFGKAYDIIRYDHTYLKDDLDFYKRLYQTVIASAKKYVGTKTATGGDALTYARYILQEKQPILFDIARENPAIIAEWPWFFMTESVPQDVAAEIVKVIPSLQLGEERAISSLEWFLAKAQTMRIPGVDEAFLALLKNNPQVANSKAMDLLSHAGANLSPEIREFLTGLVKIKGSDPEFMNQAVARRGGRIEKELTEAGVQLDKGVLMAAYRNFVAESKRKNIPASNLAFNLCRTETSRQVLLESVSAANVAEDIPGLKSAFFLRADLFHDRFGSADPEVLHKEFLSSWKGSSRDLNCQAIHAIIEEEPEFREKNGRLEAGHPVSTFYQEAIDSDLGPGKEKELMRLVTPQASYDAMKADILALYRKTQQTLVQDILAKESKGNLLLVKDDHGDYTGIRLWRGVKEEYNVPAPLESWASRSAIAAGFDGHDVWESIVPLKAILVAYISPHWGEAMDWQSASPEHEFIVIRSYISANEIASKGEDYRWPEENEPGPEPEERGGGPVWNLKNVKLAANRYYIAKPDWLPKAIDNARKFIAKTEAEAAAPANLPLTKGLPSSAEKDLQAAGLSIQYVKDILSKMEANGINLANPWASRFSSDMTYSPREILQPYYVKSLEEMVAPAVEGDTDVGVEALTMAKEGRIRELRDLTKFNHQFLVRDNEFAKKLFLTIIGSVGRISNNADSLAVASAIMHDNQNAMFAIATENPSIIAAWPWFWMENGMPAEIQTQVIKTIPSLKVDNVFDAFKVENYLDRLGGLGVPGLKEAFFSFLKGNAEIASRRAIKFLADTLRSDPFHKYVVEDPDISHYLMTLIKGRSKDPEFVSEMINQESSRIELKMKEEGMRLDETVVAEAYRRSMAKSMSEGQNADSLVHKYCSTAASRKALLEATASVSGGHNSYLPGLSNAFFLRADLMKKEYEGVAPSFMNSWRGSSRSLNCQAIHAIVEDEAEFKGKNPVSVFYREAMDSDLGPGKEKEMMRLITPQASYDVMKAEILALYQKTQQTLVDNILNRDPNGKNLLVKDENGQYTGMLLWRGISKKYNVPAPLESWASKTATAFDFDGYGIWESVVPLNAILVAYVSPGWGASLGWQSPSNEHEYIVIRSHVSVGGVSKKSQGYEWEPGMKIEKEAPAPARV